VDHPVEYLNFFYPDRTPTPGKQDRLKILIVSAYLPHLGKHGGAGRVFQLLARVAQHHDVSLCCFVETKKELEDLDQVAPYCQRIETVLRREYDPISLYPYEPFEEFNCPDFRERLERVLSEEDFDLVHFEWTQMVAYGDLFPRIPQLVTEIEVNYAAHQSLVKVEPKPLRKIKRYYDTLQTLYREVEACRKVDKVICVTDADRDFLNGYVATEKLDIVNTGVDTNFFKPADKKVIDPDAIVYVGAFRHSPNVDAMLFFCREVFPSILEERPETQLYIVGSSPPAVIRRLGQDPNITVTGFVEDIRDYYDLAQVVIVPLRTGVGIRGKILEGWAAGKAMVATSLACLGIQAIHGENIIISDEPEDFARWTLALLRNPDQCRRLGQAGRSVVVRDYEWDELGLQMTDIYSGMVDRTSDLPDLRPSEQETLEEVRA
jgi:glycosyltransferase involved in cell wall biosynthesis